MKRNFIVYKHTNKVNGKVYIGLTHNLKRRWTARGYLYKGSPLFYKAINKYGWDNFEHEVLLEGLTEQEAKEKETEFIKKYKSNNSKFGYNLTLGGDCNVPNEQVKKKISESQKAGMTEERKQKIRDSLKDRDFKGEKNPYYGKHHSEATRKKMSKKQWFKKNPEKASKLIKKNLNEGGSKSKFAKSIIRLIDGKIYDWMKECAIDNNIHVTTVKNHCKNKKSIPEFMYKKDYDLLSEKEKQILQEKLLDIKNNPNKYSLNTRKIIKIEDKKVFYSLKDCSEKEHLDQSTIIRHCKGKTTIQKYMYYDEYLAV